MELNKVELNWMKLAWNEGNGIELSEIVLNWMKLECI